MNQELNLYIGQFLRLQIYLLEKNFLKIISVNFVYIFLFKIIFSILLKILLTLSFFKIIPFVIVSGSPPLLLIITAHPLLAASKLDLPKGSFHLEHVTDIDALLKYDKTLSWL